MNKAIFSLILLILSTCLLSQTWKTQKGYHKFTYDEKDLWTKNEGKDIQHLLGVYKEEDMDINRGGFMELLEGGSGRYYWPSVGFQVDGAVLKNHISNWGFVVDDNGVIKKVKNRENSYYYELFFEVKEERFGAYRRTKEYTRVYEYTDRKILVPTGTQWQKPLENYQSSAKEPDTVNHNENIEKTENNKPENTSDVNARSAFFAAENAYNTGNFEECIRQLNSSENLLGSTNPRILHLKIKAYCKLNKYSEAYEAQKMFFEKATDTNDPKYNEIVKLVAEINRNAADNLIEEAKIFSQNEEYDKAIEAYKKSLSLNPADYVTYYRLGFAYQKNKDYDNSIDAYEKYISKVTDNFGVYHNLGIVYQLKGNYDEAISAYKKSVELEPLNWTAHENIGLMYIYKGDYETAVTVFEKNLEPNPEKFFSLQELGFCYENLGQHYKAIEYLNKAIAIDNSEGYPYRILGASYMNVKNYEKAIDALNRAIELNPNNISDYSNLGWIYLLLNQYYDALESYKEIVKLDPESIFANYYIGKIYFKFFQRPDQAKAYLDKVIELDEETSIYTIYSLSFIGKEEEALRRMNLRLDEAKNSKDAERIAAEYYDYTCLLSLNKKIDSALEKLELAIQNGYSNFEHIGQDSDLDNIRSSIEFDKLMEKYNPNYIPSAESIARNQQEPAEVKEEQEATLSLLEKVMQNQNPDPSLSVEGEAKNQEGSADDEGEEEEEGLTESGDLNEINKDTPDQANYNKTNKEDDEELETFFIVEEMPEIPGGNYAIRSFIYENMKYPEQCKTDGIQGRVFISYVVDTDGDVRNVKVTRGSHPLLDAEAIRLIRMLPKFEPGKQRGKAVNVQFTEIINFTLQ